MKKLIFLLALMSYSSYVFSQTDDSTYFTITANSEISVVADLIIFQLDISSEDPDPEQAYKNHKEKERKLVQILKELEVPDSNVVYSLLSISKAQIPRNNKNYKTRQKIRIKISDFSKYEKMQIELLKAGINEFKSIFSSKKTNEIREKGIKQLVQNAKREAEIYADNLGLRVNQVIEIESRMRRTDAGEPAFFVAAPSVDFSLLEIPQAFTVKLYATITFLLTK